MSDCFSAIGYGPLFSVKQASAYLGYKSTDVVEKAIREKEIRCVQPGLRADRRIPKSELDAWIMRLLDEKVVSQK